MPLFVKLIYQAHDYIQSEVFNFTFLNNSFYILVIPCLDLYLSSFHVKVVCYFHILHFMIKVLEIALLIMLSENVNTFVEFHKLVDFSFHFGLNLSFSPHLLN